MTTPKEALELKPCPFCGGEAESDSQRYYRNATTGRPETAAAIYCTSCNADMTWCYRDTPEVEPEQVLLLLTDQWNDRVTPAPLSCGEVRERVAKMICEDRGVDPMTLYQTSVYQPPNGMSYPEDGHFINWRNEREPMHYAYRRYERVADAILATGLVSDEAAIRGDWHTTGWDRARNSGRILLVWREFAGVREHVELGRYSDSKIAWVNTYGHPFHAEPDGWAPLLPFKTTEAIRADERERCAKWHDQKVEELKRWAGDTPSEARGMAVAACINMHRESAAAIRAGRGE